MKTKFRLFIAIVVLITTTTNKISAQGGAKWSTGLNGIGNGEGLGTSNNFPLNFYTNNSQRMSLSTTGVLKINGLSGTSFRFIQADAAGNLVSFPMGNATDVLYGNGTWGPLPASASAWNVVGNNLISTNSGNVGIGNPSPQYKLDVTGDVRISNNLLVGGGIITSQTVNATGEVRGGGGIIYNDISVGANGNFGANVNVGNNASVANNLSIGPVNTDFQLSLTPATGPNPQVFNFAKMTNLPPTPIATCLVNNFTPPAVNNFGGVITLYDLNTQMAYSTGGSILDIGAKPGSSFITSRSTPLIVNADCPQDIYLMGPKTGVGTASPSEKLHVLGNSMVDGTSFVRTGNSDALLINDQSNLNSFRVKKTGATYVGPNLNYSNGSMLTVAQPNNSDLALSLVNNNSTNATVQDFFNIYGNGYTEIKVYNPMGMPSPGGSPRALTIKDVSTATPKDIFVVNSDGKTYAREVEISLVTTFPDYVFAKDYKLRTISEVSEFISVNKHLPGFEKAEYYEKNGLNVNDMFVKQQEKIEELTLYIIELEKRLKTVESTNKKHK